MSPVTLSCCWIILYYKSLTANTRLNHILDFSRTAEMMFSVSRMYLFKDQKRRSLSNEHHCPFFEISHTGGQQKMCLFSSFSDFLTFCAHRVCWKINSKHGAQMRDHRWTIHQGADALYLQKKWYFVFAVMYLILGANKLLHQGADALYLQKNEWFWDAEDLFCVFLCVVMRSTIEVLWNEFF